MTSMTKHFKKFLKIFQDNFEFWLILSSYQIIQILYTLSEYYSNPIGLEKTFTEFS